MNDRFKFRTPIYGADGKWRKLHLQQFMLSQALTGKSKTAYGFTWEYANTHENPELLEEEKCLKKSQKQSAKQKQ